MGDNNCGFIFFVDNMIGVTYVPDARKHVATVISEPLFSDVRFETYFLPFS
jgi:hypothetical protein